MVVKLVPAFQSLGADRHQALLMGCDIEFIDNGSHGNTMVGLPRENVPKRLWFPIGSI